MSAIVLQQSGLHILEGHTPCIVLCNDCTVAVPQMATAYGLYLLSQRWAFAV